MKVSINWLNRLVDYRATPEELADKLTMAGIGVEAIEYLGGELSELIVVGYVQKVERHPDADKLSLCQVNVGQEVLQIICGASNVAEGAKVPVALPGSTLPNGTKIKKAKLRGVESNGMICSVQELGLNNNLFTKHEQEGILILNPQCQPGEKVTQALGIEDTILVLELTPNRADCLSMINVAREVAAVTGGSLKLPQVEVIEKSGELAADLAKVVIQDTESCKRYAARVIKNVTLGPSPKWMQDCLRASGIRPINNVVDVTNYVMLEYGQPLHAFDYDLLSKGTIIVRKGEKGEKMLTLDQVERELDEEMLLITDPEKAVAIAGVMGGFDTEVTAKTANVLLESAYFAGVSVRKTSRRLGLRSESSMRFEKGIDIAGVIPALDRAAQLLQQYAQGQVLSGVIDVYPSPVEAKQVALRLSRTNQLLGTSLLINDLQTIFDKLGFVYKLEESKLIVDVPSYRRDIELEVDLIEEVARLYGYSNIPTSMPVGELTQGKKKEHQVIEDLSRDILTGCGLTEIITYSFNSQRIFDKLNLPDGDSSRDGVAVFNPLSDEQAIMRTTLINGLLEVATKNIKRRTINIQIFEIGKKYTPSINKLPIETNLIAGLITGKAEKGWNWPEGVNDFYTLKGILDRLLSNLGVEEVKYVSCIDNPSYHPGRTAKLYVGEKSLGYAGEISPIVASNYELNQKCYIFELNLDLIVELGQLTKKYQSLPKYPSTERDLAILVKEDVLADEIIAVIKNAAGNLLISVNLFDLYKGAQIREGYKSLAYNLVYQAQDRTLTDDEVNGLQEKVRKAVAEGLGAELR